MSEKRRRKSKMNIPMCLACILLCLTMFSLHLMSGLYARYVVSGSGGDSARVAAFGDVTIKESGDLITENIGGEDYTYLIVAPGVNLSKNVQISFTGSEMACFLFVVVKPTGWIGIETDGKVLEFNAFEEANLDKSITWEINDTEWTYLTKDAAGQYIYYKVMSPNETITEVDFIKNGDIKVGESVTNSTIVTFSETGKNRKLDFTAIAIQYDGESTALEMWDKAKDK